MLYLRRFQLPSEAAEWRFLVENREIKRTCYGSRYPFGFFPPKKMPALTFAPITILCGGNGSGKTTLLNLIGESLSLPRKAVYNRSAFFNDYLHLCALETAVSFTPTVRQQSRVITSDDVFDYLLDLRCMNEGIGVRQRELLAEYVEKRHAELRFHSLEDLDALRDTVDAQRKSGSQYVRSRIANDIPEKSNGESAFLYFTREIGQKALYLLDEPENSLSAQLQLELKQFLEDSVRFYGCQLIIATHSPFLLSLKDAEIYDLDRMPVSRCRWTEVDNVRTFYEFFQAHQREFS